MKRPITLLLLAAASTLTANTFYLDPLNGDLSNPGTASAPWPTLEAVINAGFIRSQAYSPLPYDPQSSSLIVKNPNGLVQAGDTLVLLEGLHGSIFLQNYINSEPIVIVGAAGQTPILEKVHLQACKNWRFEGLAVSTEPYGYYLANRLFYIESHGWQGPASHIEVDHCTIYSTTAPWATAAEWVSQASHGLYIKGDSVTATYNRIENIDMGLTAQGDHILAEHNEVINFSGDGMRLLGSYNTFRSNLIKNCYDVDDNHDDGIQSWTTNGLIVDHNTVIGNIIINTDDPDRPLNGPLQGIGCFDGFYNDWLVANNVIHVNHWHGITFLGANDCRIFNNTVLDPTPDITPGGSWIRIDDHKNGMPSSNCVLANNVANQFNVDGLEVSNVVLDSYQEYAEHFVDYTIMDFHLLPTSTLINAADPAYAPDTDLDNNSRLNDLAPDVGAYEYVEPTSGNVTRGVGGLLVYPNPFSDQVYIPTAKADWLLECYTLQGRRVLQQVVGTGQVRLAQLPAGCYLLRLTDREGVVRGMQKIVKQ
ncbi:MAG: right-handed parallel beta-helix repeat-containing protein [Phaeodactylibacter sp.]|nr:right-handed parallel beta-helix repeat-containing protein [Phaeodactylibacter sp.]